MNNISNLINFKLDHIGIAVHSLEPAIEKYVKFFTCKVSHKETIVHQSVDVVFIELPDSRIELIAPMKKDVLATQPTISPATSLPHQTDSAVQRFLNKRGPGLHHLCYLVEDLIKELSNFEKLGAELIDKTPRIGAEGKLVAFINPKSFDGVLIELVQNISLISS